MPVTPARPNFSSCHRRSHTWSFLQSQSTEGEHGKATDRGEASGTSSDGGRGGGRGAVAGRRRLGSNGGRAVSGSSGHRLGGLASLSRSGSGRSSSLSGLLGSGSRAAAAALASVGTELLGGGEDLVCGERYHVSRLVLSRPICPYDSSRRGY